MAPGVPLVVPALLVALAPLWQTVLHYPAERRAAAAVL